MVKVRGHIKEKAHYNIIIFGHSTTLLTSQKINKNNFPFPASLFPPQSLLNMISIRTILWKRRYLVMRVCVGNTDRSFDEVNILVGKYPR